MRYLSETATVRLRTFVRSEARESFCRRLALQRTSQDNRLAQCKRNVA